MKENKPLEMLRYLRDLLPDPFRKGPFFAAMGAFVFSLIIVLGYMNSDNGRIDFDEFEVGRVADRDVTADYSITYQDMEATRLRQEEEEHLVPSVFHYSPIITEEAKNNWKQFAALVLDDENGSSIEDFSAAIHKRFPGYISDDVVKFLYDRADKQQLLDQAATVLDSIMETGVFLIPDANLEKLNPDVAELVRYSGSRIERERIPYALIITGEQIPNSIERRINGSASPELSAVIISMLTPFVAHNVFYSPEETEQRLALARSNTEPVMKTIERGQRIIRKGFIIAQEDLDELEILNRSRDNDLRGVISTILRLLLLFIFIVFFCGKRIIDRDLKDSEVYMVCILSVLYITGAVLARNLFLNNMNIPVSLVIPSALVIMLPAILIHPRLALILSLTLPLAAFFSDAYDMPAFIFALVSGTAASYVVQNTEKRMDLVKAGILIAVANCVAMTALLLNSHAEAGSYPILLFWAAFNGIGSGMLVLGFLPLLEQALNAATSFRLVELSDLNAPILRSLFTRAPGTYSHSIMVANLAESACQDIKANASLARVGAYYHDLGKMENPMYFVENQGDYNPHDDMEPLHSVTVLRSHVKLGVEKARQLKLPREVVSIIAEHHGNSVITWFYNKALKRDQEGEKAGINVDDFRYPGNPPRSRESAVVMLADVSEAAIRTLDKPTPAKMEKFIQELFTAKVEQGQLANSELTFRDLETIKKAFVGVLTGYYHSRIEYPKVIIPASDEQSEMAAGVIGDSGTDAKEAVQ